MILILIISLLISPFLSQPSYYLNQIYSQANTQISRIILTPDKSTLIVIPIVGGFIAYNRSSDSSGNYTSVQKISMFQSLSGGDLSPDGNVIAVGTAAGRIYVYKRQAGVYGLSQNISVGSSATSMALATDRSILVGGFVDKVVRVYKETAVGMYVLQQWLTESTGQIQDVRISEDKELVLSGASNGVCRIYALNSGGTYVLNQTISDTLTRLNSIRISPNNSLLYTAADDSRIRIYEKRQQVSGATSTTSFQTQQILLQQGFQIIVMQISNDGSLIVTGSNDFKTRIYSNTRNGYILNQTLSGGNKKITTVSIYNDNSGILTGSQDYAKVRQYSSCFSVMPGCSVCLSAIFCSVCSEGYYYGNGECVRCTQPCGHCISDSVCTSCEEGYTLNGISCGLELSLESVHRLIYYLTIPLYVMCGVLMIGIAVMIWKLRKGNSIGNKDKEKDKQVNDNFNFQVEVINTQDMPELEKKRKKKKNDGLNITVEELEPQDTINSSGSNYQDISVSKMAFE